MPSNTWDYFKMVIIIQLIFGLGATMIAHALPERTYLTISEQITPEEIESLENLSGNFTSDIENMRNPPVKIPVINTAFLLFFSGNIVIDAFLNSLFAIPSMATGLITGLGVFLPIDPFFQTMLSLFLYSIIAVLYIIGIIGVIMNLRSQGGLTNVV